MIESWRGWITCSNALHLGLKGSKETRKMGSTVMRFSTRFAVPMLLVVQHFLTAWLTDRDAYAYGDHGLGIAGFGATISAPHMVRLEMTDVLMDYPWCTSILIWINAIFLLCLFLGPDSFVDSKIVGMGIIIAAFILSVIAGGLLEARDVCAGCWVWIRLLDCCVWPHGLWISNTLAPLNYFFLCSYTHWRFIFWSSGQATWTAVSVFARLMVFVDFTHSWAPLFFFSAKICRKKPGIL